MNTGEFQLEDFGKKEDQKRYGQDTAPILDLTKIQKMPMGLFSGSMDELADPTDVAWLRSQIKDDLKLVDVNYEDFGHSTFNIGKYYEVERFLPDLLTFLDKCFKLDAETSM